MVDQSESILGSSDELSKRQDDDAIANTGAIITIDALNRGGTVRRRLGLQRAVSCRMGKGRPNGFGCNFFGKLRDKEVARSFCCDRSIHWCIDVRRMRCRSRIDRLPDRRIDSRCDRTTGRKSARAASVRELDESIRKWIVCDRKLVQHGRMGWRG